MSADKRPLSNRELERVRSRAEAASPAPWFYNSYSAIFSQPMLQVDEDYWTEDRFSDGHNYDKRIPCVACGKGACERAAEALDMDPLVAHVPSSYGDTATGQRVHNAIFIAEARQDVVALIAEVEWWKRQSRSHKREAQRQRAIKRKQADQIEDLVDKVTEATEDAATAYQQGQHDTARYLLRVAEVARSNERKTDMANETQTANLNDSNGTLVGQTTVSAFPNQPDIVKWGNRYFHNGEIGYGVTTLAYTEGSFYEVPSKPDASE